MCSPRSTKNDYGEFDGLIPAIFPALGKPGIAALKARLIAAMPRRAATDRFDSRDATVRRALQDLADGEGDVDAYIALVPGKDRTRPDLAAEIGRRLLAAGRANEAVAALEVATPKKRTTRSDLDDDDLYGPGWEGPDAEWESVYIDALVATGQIEHAQRLRWAAFEERLSVERLRSYLKALPDFEDVLAEDRAMEHALRFPHFSAALHFFHEWSAHRQAADLVVARHGEINGNLYYLLDPAARWLEGAHPLAATLLRRAMIEDTLDGAKSKRYRHAARHLAECRALASAHQRLRRVRDARGFRLTSPRQAQPEIGLLDADRRSRPRSLPRIPAERSACCSRPVRGPKGGKNVRINQDLQWHRRCRGDPPWRTEGPIPVAPKAGRLRLL